MDEAQRLFPQIKLYSFPKKKTTSGRIKSIFSPYSYMFSPEFLDDFKLEASRGYDVIHVEQLWAGWAIPQELIHKTLINIHHLVTIDLEETKKEKWKEIYEYFQTVRAEKKLVRKFPYKRFFSNRLLEKSKEFKPISVGLNEVIPFSVDLDLYNAQKPIGQNLSVGMIASMGWYPGKSAALNLIKEIYPLIKSQKPECQLRLAGWNARRELAGFLNQDGVEILENIPVVEDFFKSLSVFVYMPSRGSGMKIKVMEAMLYGIPVVTTLEGLEGLPAVHGTHAMIAQDNQMAASYALELLADSKLRDRLSKNACTMIHEHCHKDSIMRKIENLYENIIQK